jgi:hypothetical protein
MVNGFRTRAAVHTSSRWFYEVYVQISKYSIAKPVKTGSEQVLMKLSKKVLY